MSDDSILVYLVALACEMQTTDRVTESKDSVAEEIESTRLIFAVSLQRRARTIVVSRRRPQTGTRPT